MKRLALIALLALTACGTGDDTVENLADRIEADLKALDGVSEVVVQYHSDLDNRQRLTVTATTQNQPIADQALEIVKRDYWTGTGRRVDFRVRFANPSGVELRKSDVTFKLGDVVEMERKYGKRSEAGELDPGR